MRLIDLKEDTNFTLQNQLAVKGQKLGFCLYSLIFSLPTTSCLSHRGDFHACSHFARSTIPEEKWGLLVVYSNWGHLDKVDQSDYGKITILAKKVGCRPISSL